MLSSKNNWLRTTTANHLIYFFSVPSPRHFIFIFKTNLMHCKNLYGLFTPAECFYRFWDEVFSYPLKVKNLHSIVFTHESFPFSKPWKGIYIFPGVGMDHNTPLFFRFYPLSTGLPQHPIGKRSQAIQLNLWTNKENNLSLLFRYKNQFITSFVSHLESPALSCFHLEWNPFHFIKVEFSFLSFRMSFPLLPVVSGITWPVAVSINIPPTIFFFKIP